MESEAAWEVLEAWWLDQGLTPEAPSVLNLVRFLEDQKAVGEPVKELRKFLDALGRAVRLRGLDDVAKVDAVVSTLAGSGLASGAAAVLGRTSAAGAADALPAAATDVLEPVGLPPLLLGHSTAPVEVKVAGFYRSVATLFEAWLARRTSENTKRAYRADVMDLALRAARSSAAPVCRSART